MIDRPLVSLVLIITPIVVLGVVELLARRFHVKTELTRKAAHIALGVIAVLGFYEGPLWLYVLSITGLMAFLVLAQRRRLLKSLHAIERPSFGDAFFPIGLLAPLPLTLSHPDVYVTSILVVTFADSAAGLVGHLRKKKSKSLHGSLAFFVVAIVVLGLTTTLTFGFIALVAALVTIVERFSTFGLDNLTVPLATTALLLLF
jgi:phytol kinase